MEFITKLKESHDAFAASRREVIGLASRMQTLSKRAIFAFQRGEMKEGSLMVAEVESLSLEVIEKAKTTPRLINEGSYRAALEEYAEAVFFRQILETEKVELIAHLDEDTQIGGLSDMIGEVVRRMIVLVTEGESEKARAMKVSIEPVMEGLNQLDYRGSLRGKYDQAVRHYRKAEEILYDISLKN